MIKDNILYTILLALVFFIVGFLIGNMNGSKANSEEIVFTKSSPLINVIEAKDLPGKAKNLIHKGNGWFTFELDNNNYLYHYNSYYKFESITQIK